MNIYEKYFGTVIENTQKELLKIMVMKKILIVLASIMLFSSFEITQTDDDRIPNNAYKTGEELEYLLYYGLIDGGKAKLTIRDASSNGKQITHAKAEAKTMGFTRMFIAIDDVYESYFDETNCKPIKAIRDIKEDDYKFYNEVTYNHDNNTVNSSKSGTVDVPENIFDILSSLYYMRRTSFDNLKLNETVESVIYFSDEVFPYKVIFKGREVIETKIGKFNALKFQPVVEVGRVFKEDDDMRFWISDDENHLPLRAEFDILVGSIKCDLIKYNGVKNPLAKVN